MLRRFAIGLPLLVLSFQTLADEDPNVTQMKKLYSKLAEAVSVTPNTIRAGGTFLVLASPGILLEPNLDVDGNEQDRVLLNSLVEKTMDADWIYRPRTRLSSDIYRRILTYHQAPIYSLESKIKAELDGYNKEIFTEKDGARDYTAAWKQFLDLRAKYAVAIDTARMWLNNNAGKALPAQQANELANAKDAYLNLGDGIRRSIILQRKREYAAFDPESWWTELQDFFDQNTDSIGGRPYPRNLYYPRYSSWINPTTVWTTVSISQTDLERTTINQSSSSGGGLDASWGLWRVNVAGSGSSSGSRLEVNLSSISLSFQVLRVNIERPWMDSLVFYSRAWRWGCGELDRPVISDGGDPTHGQQVAGIMPFLPTGILIAKDLKIRADLSKEVQDRFNSVSSGGGGISFGPFRLGGRRAESNSREYVSAKATGTGVEFKEPQIIGFFVEVLRSSPNPNPELKFQSCGDATGSDRTAKIDEDSLHLLRNHLKSFQAKEGDRM